MSDKTPSVWVKGSVRRLAHTPSDEVALTFDGFKREQEVAEPQEEAAPSVTVSDEAPVKDKTSKVPTPSIFDDRN